VILCSESICPLCSQVFPSEMLQNHIASEHPRLRHRTIKVIQAYHPGWLEEHGACGPCWRSYRDASQILNVIKCTKPHLVVDSAKAGELTVDRHDKAQTTAHEPR
jgi:hypothetical protein